MKIPDKVKKLFDTTSLVALGTSDKKGNPNVNVVFWKMLLDNESILLIDNFMKTTKENLFENNRVCLSFWNPKTEEGYKIKGKGTYYLKGKIFDTGKKFLQSKNPNRIPKGVIKIDTNEIYILTPGANAGNKLL